MSSELENISPESSLAFFPGYKQKISQALTFLKLSLGAIRRSKALRQIFKLGLSLGLLLWVSIASLAVLVDPNDYKDLIEKTVLEKTGKVVNLEGDLHFRVLPLALEARQVLVKEHPTKKLPILKIDTVKVFPSLRALVFGKFGCHLELMQVHYKGFFIPKIKTRIMQNKDIITLHHTKTSLKKGHEEGVLEIDKFQIDTQSQHPKYEIEHQGKNFQLPLLLSTLGLDHKIIGNAQVKMHLNAEGDTLPSIVNSLKGDIELEVIDGRFYGVDLIHTLQEARSLLSTVSSGFVKPFVQLAKLLKSKKKPVIQEKTPFRSLKILAKVEHGIVQNHDLQIEHKQYDVKGTGKINLMKRTANYQIQAHYKEPKANHKSQKTAPLMVHITGPIEDLNVKPDFHSYMQYIK